MKHSKLIIILLLSLLLFSGMLVGCNRNTDYLLTLNTGGGSEDGTIVALNSDNAELPNPQKNGYNFIGWFSDASLSTPFSLEQIFDEASTIKFGDNDTKYIFASYEAIAFNINYYTNGGTNDITNPTSYTIEDSFDLKNPTRSGYTFEGWYENEVFSGDSISTVPIGTIGIKSYFAKWSPYDITYYLNNGTNNPNNVSSYDGTSEITLYSPTKTGYSFAGWYDNPSFSGSAITNISAGSSRNRDFYAKWTLNNYSISYALNGGTNNEQNPTAYTVQNTITFTNASKNGYSFVGWYNSANDTKVTSISQGTAGNLSLYAKWTPIVYSITYMLYDGTNNEENPTTYTIEQAITLKGASKDGYTFNGWRDATNNVVVAININSTGNKVFYAQWQEVIYSLNYVLDGGTNSPSNPGVYTVERDISLKAPTKQGYAFKGWYLDSTFANTAITDIPILDTIGNIVLYAKFLVQYPITYNLNGGINKSQNPNTYTTEDNISLLAPSKTGYNFGGWYKHSDFSDEEVMEIEEGNTSPQTFYAKWLKISYTVTYYLKGGQEQVTNPTTYTIEDTVTLNAPSREGYTFAGWYTSEAYTGNAVTNIAAGSTGNRNLYAKWQETKYQIIYDLSSGTNHFSNPATYTINTAVSFANASRNGYVFEGWYTDIAKTQRIESINLGSTGNINIYAKFYQLYNITYVLNGGQNNNENPPTYTVVDSFTLKNPTKVGSRFIGWYANSVFTGEKITTVAAGATGEKTFYARFFIEYTITYNLDEGTNSPQNPSKFTIEEQIEFSEPTKTGYEFIGWYKESNYATKITQIPLGSNQNISVYACWEINVYDINYILYDGSNNSSNPLQYTVNDNISLLSATRSGYKFIGWYNNDTFTGNKITAITAGNTGDKYLYAKFLYIYGVTYELAGGTNSVSNPTTFTSDNVIQLLPAALTGYDFVGWSLNGNIITTTSGLEENITLYAQWQVINYAINFHLDNGTTLNPTSYTINDSLILLDASKLHYSFIGWYNNGTFEGEPIETIAEGTTGEITLYAKYKAFDYPINYNLNGGKNSDTNPATYTIFDQLSIKSATKNESTFLGWFDNAQFNGAPITTINLGTFGTISLYAKWQIKTYKIEYMLFGGTNNESNPAHYNSDDTFVFNPATKAEYDFGGWFAYDTRGTSTSDLQNNNIRPITEIELGSIGNMVLYARWLADEYPISYVLNGAINNNNNPSNYTRDNYIILYAPTKAGYTFKGWYNNPTFSGNAISIISEGTTGNKTFYAKFSLTYYVSYLLYGGSFNTDITSFTEADSDILLGTPIKSGFIFSGWYENAGFTGTQITKIAAGSIGDKALHAKFLQEFNITYSLNSGTNNISNPQKYTIEDSIALQEATRLGYMFIGWYDNASFNGLAKTEIVSGVGGNLNLYAKFLFINELAYTLNGGTNNPSNPSFFTIEDNKNLENPTRTGYDFEGWFDNANFLGNPIAVVGSASSGLRNLYAKWKIIDYVITYNLNGGSNNASNPSKYTVATPTITLLYPNRLNYQFVGWYNNTELVGTPITNIALGSTGGKVFYAKWVAIDFAISYNLNGGTNAPTNPTSYNVNSSTIVLNNPTRIGATFANWYDNSSFSGSPITSIIAGSVGARMLYAKWQLTNYNIVYNLNGGGYASTNTYNVDNNVTFGTASKAYNTFIGWYENADFSGEKLVDTVGRTGEIIVYARFSPTYFINYTLNGGTNNASNLDSFTQLSPTIALLPPTKNSYNFINWYQEPDFSGGAITQIANGTNYSINLYAKWAPTVYDIIYNTNGGTNHASNPTNYTIESATIYLQDPTKAGCQFVGWYDNIEQVGNIITAIPLGSKGNKELYAKWSLINYTLTYHLNGGTNSANNPSNYNVETPQITLMAPNKNYYNFLGWYDNEQFSGNTISVIATGSTVNVQLYAKYDAITYNISYHLSGGTNDLSNPSSYSYESNILLGAPSRNFYIFVDWYTNEYLTGNPISTISARSGNLNLYAKWRAITYEIVYSLNGGNNHLDNPVAYTIETVIALKNPTKAAYNFLGWYDNPNFLGDAIVNIQEGSYGDIIFYAKFLLSYNITYNLNDGTNNAQNRNSYTVEESVQLYSPTKPNSIFIGWYSNAMFSGDAVTEITAGSTGAKVFYARFEFIYNITYNLNGGTNNESNPSYYTQEINVPLFAPERAGYMFLGWYTNAQCNGDPINTINGTEMRNIVLFAWWGEWGYFLNYGEYPQSQLTEMGTISALNSGITSGTIVADSQGYYPYGGERYAKVVQQSTTNGYDSGQTYYFLVEPIKWRIIQEDNGEVMLLSEIILDSLSYNELYASISWELSSIREWLNNNFYNQAFYDNNYHILQTETNTSTNPVYNTSSGAVTMDNIKLLSIENMIDTNLGFSLQLTAEDESRVAKNSDYALARGAYSDEEGNGMWWLYSRGSNDKYASFVGCDGKVYTNGDNVTMFYYGIRPTMYITLNKVD